MNVGNIVTVITRPDAFTNAQWQAARDEASGAGLQDMLGPDVAFDAVTSTLMSGKADAAFFASLPENIAPSTDDNPFFFYTARLGDICHPVHGRRCEEQCGDHHDPVADRRRALRLRRITSSLPFVRLARRMPLSTLTPPVTYFSAIGMGFMLIEISQMQRLMVFLGHPVYGLSVVLFTILLFSGIGSATVGARGPRTGRGHRAGSRAPDHARGWRGY